MKLPTAPPPLRPFSLGILAVLVAAAHAVPRQETVPDARRGALQRVAPEAEDSEGSSVFQRDFRREQWLARLQEPDLAHRERSFDALLKRARLDPVARAFLEELARDADAGELAWTARLALRELGRASFPVPWLGGILPGTDPLAMSKRMEQMLQSLLAQEGMGILLPQIRLGPDAGTGGGAARSVRVEQDAGGTRVHVTEFVDGAETTRTYAGASLEEILAENQELARELGGGFLRLLGRDAGGVVLAPQGRSRPLITDRLGVILRDPGGDAGERSGLLVERIYPETYAYLLGVRSGSVLLELNGEPLRAVADIERVMRARGPDDPLTLVWLDELGQRQERTWQPGNR